MRFSDIQLTDKELWEQYKTAWDNDNYVNALNILNNTQLVKKELTANMLNSLTDDIVELENTSDPNFKSDKIKVSKTIPSGLTSGQIYFKWVD